MPHLLDLTDWSMQGVGEQAQPYHLRTLETHGLVLHSGECQPWLLPVHARGRSCVCLRLEEGKRKKEKAQLGITEACEFCVMVTFLG